MSTTRCARLSPWLMLAGILVAGCSAPAEQADLPEQQVAPPDLLGDWSEGVAVHRFSCRVLAEDSRPLESATCSFSNASTVLERQVTSEGVAQVNVVQGTLVDVTASAPGYDSMTSSVHVTGNTRLTFALKSPDPLLPSIPVQNDTAPPESEVALPPPPAWGQPVNVTKTGYEPHLIVAPSGTIYYAPSTDLGKGLHRSRDGGSTWEPIEPEWTEALPTLGSDTSVNVAPDGSLWYARYWGWPDATIGCTSIDEGDSWTCDNLAIPGVTDRMWIAGVNKDIGYLEASVGLRINTFAKTETGSEKYVPWGVEEDFYTLRVGNMVVDPETGAVYQIMHNTGPLKILRIDSTSGVISTHRTDVPAPKNLPWLSLRDGVMWTTSEPEASDGSRGLTLARSLDFGQTWTQSPIQSEAQSITFSFAAAGPDGRVAAVYYGSNMAGVPSNNGDGTWGLYVVESSNALDDDPVWVERQIVEGIHVGSICAGSGCEPSRDPEARFSGDLIGIWLDDDGLAHVAYNDDTNPGLLNRYIRQFPST